MTDDDIAFLPVTALGESLAASRLSCLELTQIYLQRIARLDSVARAFIEVTGDAACAAAGRADEARGSVGLSSALHGIPFASKGLIDIAGVKTTAGSRVLADNVANANAHLVERMFAAHAISLGKLNLHQFAYGGTGENPIYGTAVNAHGHDRIAGGSSSGSAAAVSFGLAPFAFGTDTGGSVRAPAALNGLVGLKPTIGRISTHGVVPYCRTLDHVGIIARTVEDAALVLQAVTGFDSRDPASTDEPVDDYRAKFGADLCGLRVGRPRRFYCEHCDEEILEASERALLWFEAQGARLVDVDLPSMEQARSVSLTLQMPEALSFHSRYPEDRGELYGPDFRAGLALGQCLLAEHYVRAKRVQTHHRQGTNAAFDQVDVVLTPATPLVAPKIGQSTADTGGLREAAGNAIMRYTTFFNMTGHPANTVPSGLHSLGLPLGIQIIGRHFDEATVLAVAAALNAEPSFSIPCPDLRPQ